MKKLQKNLLKKIILTVVVGLIVIIAGVKYYRQYQTAQAFEQLQRTLNNMPASDLKSFSQIGNVIDNAGIIVADARIELSSSFAAPERIPKGQPIDCTPAVLQDLCHRGRDAAFDICVSNAGVDAASCSRNPDGTIKDPTACKSSKCDDGTDNTVADYTRAAERCQTQRVQNADDWCPERPEFCDNKPNPAECKAKNFQIAECRNAHYDDFSRCTPAGAPKCNPDLCRRSEGGTVAKLNTCRQKIQSKNDYGGLRKAVRSYSVYKGILRRYQIQCNNGAPINCGENGPAKVYEQCSNGGR